MVKTTLGFEPMAERYEFDFRRCKVSDGWAQLDSKQDAPYYGQWVNPLTLKIATYCEGDTTLIECDNEVDFKAQLSSVIQWNKDAGYWIGIDAGFSKPIIEAFERLGFGDTLH